MNERGGGRLAFSVFIEDLSHSIPQQKYLLVLYYSMVFLLSTSIFQVLFRVLFLSLKSLLELCFS